MENTIPKQFLNVRNQPLILLSALRIIQSVPVHSIVVVCHEAYHDKIKKIFSAISLPLYLAENGPERFYSIRNAMAFLSDKPDEGVLIHDAVRPFASDPTIRGVVQKTEQTGAAVPFVTIGESLRKITSDGSRVANRKEFVIVQTPQCFPCNIITRAYTQPYREHFTDDASVAEKAGCSISLVPGNIENIKITYPHDLLLAEYFYDKFFQ